MNFPKEFFEFNRPTNNNNTISGQCKLCEKVYSDKAGSTGNFHKHLKRKHPNPYEKSKFPDSIPSNNDINTSEHLENLSDYTKKINQAILEELMVKCNLPPAIIENTAFRKFLKTFAPKWKHTSSRYFTIALLPSLANATQDTIKNLLNEINHLSITGDVWSDRRGKSFIGITGHFLDSKCIPQALLLDFRRLKGSHTGDNIRNITEEKLESLKVSNFSYYSLNLYEF
jgi:hypothetical protein